MARLSWAIAEHIDIEGLDPLLADDPDDPLNVIISNIHKVLFNVDSTAEITNRVQDVQAVLISAQRLGSRHPRAGQLITKELEEFRNNPLADSVSKHQCRLILQRIKYASNHQDSRCDYCANVHNHNVWWCIANLVFHVVIGHYLIRIANSSFLFYDCKKINPVMVLVWFLIILLLDLLEMCIIGRKGGTKGEYSFTVELEGSLYKDEDSQ